MVKVDDRGDERRRGDDGGGNRRDHRGRPLTDRPEGFGRRHPGGSRSGGSSAGAPGPLLLPRDAAAEAPTLPWYSPESYLPLSSEEALAPLLVQLGKKERGMMRDQPPFRLPQVLAMCRRLGVSVSTALSLRRHQMKALNPRAMCMSHLGLGRNEDILEAATIFEDSVEEYLRAAGVPYITEEQQRERSSGPLKATPDFLLSKPVSLTFERSGRPASLANPIRKSKKKKNRSAQVRTIGTVGWIEAKMFYGASSIPQGENSAVGRIMQTAEKYVALYGPGAMVFSYGCGRDLALRLGALGVAALDAHPVNLERLKKQQKTWCADREGRILP